MNWFDLACILGLYFYRFCLRLWFWREDVVLGGVDCDVCVWSSLVCV